MSEVAASGAPPSVPNAPAPQVAVQLRDVAGALYAPLVSAQLDQERSRKASIEGRAITIVSTSGGLLTLFTGFVAVMKATSHDLPAGLVIPLGIAYGLFAAAAVCGIVSSARGNTLESYGEFHTDLLRGWFADWTSTDTATAAQGIADQQLTLLGKMRGDDLTKWRFLVAGVSLQILAVAVFAGSLGYALLH